MINLFLKAYKQQEFMNHQFMYSMFGLAVEDNEYLRIVGDEVYVTLNNEEFGPFSTSEPILDFQEEITIPIATTPLIKKQENTTIGIAVVNQILIEYGLNSKYEFQPDGVDGNEMHKRIIRDLQDTSSNITVEDYKRWSSEIMYIRNQAQLFIVSTTEKTISKPDWLDKFMVDKALEYDKIYGKDWKQDNLRILKYEEEVMAKYADYLKDDPTWGIITSGKVFKQSMKKRYVSIGILDGIRGKPKAILSRLADGYEKDADTLAAVFNNIVHGSHSRGSQVVVAGVTSKRLIEALHQYKIDVDDCKVTKGFDVLVNKHNRDYIIGCYYIEGGHVLHITKDNIDSLVGKTIEMRYPTKCKAKTGGFCKICVGDKLANLNGGIPLIAIMTGGMGVSFFMSKFHATTRGLYKIDIDILK